MEFTFSRSRDFIFIINSPVLPTQNSSVCTYKMASIESFESANVVNQDKALAGISLSFSYLEMISENISARARKLSVMNVT